MVWLLLPSLLKCLVLIRICLIYWFGRTTTLPHHLPIYIYIYVYMCVYSQPGNGGPVEDWINCEILHNAAPGTNGAGGGGVGATTTTVIVNGALDKVRDGYYPSIFFPALAATIDRFYSTFESILYLRPLSDKGCYGWLYRVYPEPWQVVLQTTRTSTSQQGGGVGSKLVVEDTVVYTSETRPSFGKALEMMLQGAAAKNQKQ
jgi:hypothetical protein